MKPGKELTKHLEFSILAIITVLFIPFFGTNLTIDPVLIPRFLVWSIATFVLFACLALRLCKNSESIDRGILRRTIFVTFLGYFLFSLISLTRAINITEGFHEVLKTFVCIVYLFVSTTILSKNKNYIPILVKTMTITAVLLCAIAVCEYVKTGLIFESGTMANRNLLSSAFFLMLPFCLYGILAFRSYWRFISFIPAALILFSIFSLRARSVWAAIIVSTVVTVFVVMYHINKVSTQKKTKPLSFKGVLYVTIILSIVILIAGHFYFRSDSTGHSIKQIWSTESIKERGLMWNKSLKLIKDNLIFGVGAGNWKIYLPSYGLDKLTERSFKTDFFQRPHNDYIWILSEIGILGFLLYLSIFVIITVYIFKILIHASETNSKLLTIFMFFGLIGYMVISFFSFPKERIFHSVILMLMMAVVISTYHRSFTHNKIISRPFMLALAVPSLFILLLAMINGHTRLKAEIHTKRAFAARGVQNWPMVVSEIDKGYSAFATLDPMSTPLQWYRGEANLSMNNVSQALEDYKSAYKANPYHIHVSNNLGTAYELVGDHDRAIYFYKKALEIYPEFEEALINLGATYYNSGSYEKAYEVLLRCDPNTKDPRFEGHLESVKKKLDKGRRHQ